jgi:hypothetical protein
MENTGIQKYESIENNLQKFSFNENKEIANYFIKSGLFSDIKSDAQAVVKILAGQELGLMPFQSMFGIDIILGKAALKPELMAGLLKKSGHYNYRVLETTGEKCIIDFYENGQVIGQTIYTIGDATKMQLSGKDNYKKQPKVMLFYRAMSQGIKMFCPDLFLCPVYNTFDFPELENKEISVSPIEETNKQINDITNKISTAQRKRLFAISKEKGITHEEVKEFILKEFNLNSTNDLTPSNYDVVCAWIENYIKDIPEEEFIDRTIEALTDREILFTDYAEKEPF